VAVALLVVALVVRVGGAAGSFGNDLVFDAKDFDRHARSIATGHGYPEAVHPRDGPSALRPPAFPAALAAVYVLRGGVERPPDWRTYFDPRYKPDAQAADAGRILQALIGTVTAALVGLVAFQLFGRRVGLVSLAIAAVYPPLVLLGFTLLSDPMFVMVELAAVAAALRARDSPHPLRWAIAAGVLVGVGWLTRGNGYVLLLPLALLVWVVRPRLSRRALAAPALLLLAAALTIMPWTIRNAVVMDAFIPVSDTGGYTLAGAYNESARNDSHFRGGWRPAQDDPEYGRLAAKTTGELDQSQQLGREARRLIARHPLYVGEVAGCNTLRLAYLAWLVCGDRRDVTTGYEVEEGAPHSLALLAVLSFALVALLAFAGAFTHKARAAPRALWLVPVAMWTAVFVLAANRFRAPLEPFLIMLAALALVSGWERVVRRRVEVRAGEPSVGSGA
jgi:4-amino-4-deoxy-L-arabinose transferase-like glycosyltransferase